MSDRTIGEASGETRPPDALRPSAETAFGAWTERVRANREQIERLREDVREADFWASRSGQFRPAQEQPGELPALRSLARPDDVWLDIGAGGGRYAVPLAGAVRELIAVEPSPAMREQLAAAAAEAGRSNVRIVAGAWPEAWAGASGNGHAAVDVSLTCHVLYDQDDLRAFIEAMEAHTTRLCAVVLGDRAPSSAFEDTWSDLHGEPAALLPARTELLACLGALDRPFEVRTFPLPRPQAVTVDPLPRPEAITVEEGMAMARRLFWVGEGSPKDAALRRLLVKRYGVADDQIVLPPRLNHTALVTWAP